MSDLTPGKATICVVNYKTADLTRACLRSVRQHTDPLHDVLVIDNGSGDSSLDYLKTLSWIRLVERRSEASDPNGIWAGTWAHGAALDLGLSLCQTEFFVAMHSDTVVLRPDWLAYLIARLGRDPAVACCGGDKVERKLRWHALLKGAFDVKALHRRLFADPAVRMRYRPFVRTICAVYRTEILRNQRLSFLPDIARRLTVGQKLYLDLRERGYKTVELPGVILRRYLIHLAHGTQMLNPGEFGLVRVTRKWHRVMGPWLGSESFQALLRDERLDR